MKKAVAIRYEKSLPAPFIVAKGRGELALKIKEIAENNNVGIVYDTDLADNLEMIDIGTFIPEEYYQIIAEILIFLGRVGQ
ncbi:MAG: EscU/YscU/HrcU family type III secretion system export apparatus switch protein [Spirochaetales bacterium]|nr:EscU/YscU/HrcU family type III secretion system export apparatus switch protein [Spirochaetales bacterium]